MVEKPFKMIVYAGLVRALWGTGIEDVAGFEGEESTDIGYQLIYLKQHIARTTLLHGASVDI